MGGRGASSGGGGGGGGYGGHGSLAGLIGAMRENIQNNNGQGTGNNIFHSGEGNNGPGYTAGNNPALLKWQGQNDDTKTARYLAKLGKQQTPAQDAEGYAYYQSPFQNMVIDQGLNAPVYAKLSGSDFDTYCRQNNLTPIYRGVSGQAAKDRFMNAAASHTGTGMYGEGYYFGDRGTASSYGSTTIVGALSPQAHVVDLSTVRSAIAAQSSGVKSALSHSGNTPGYFSNNSGEAQMALKMGYNVIRTDWSYVVLTRDALVVRR